MEIGQTNCKAYMSDASARHSDDTRPDTWNMAHAVREAERIVAEAEAEEVLFHGSRRTFYRAVSESVMSHSGAHREARADLAADLAAIMPELDRLALESAGDYFPSADGQSLGYYCRDPRALAMIERNRATLAAMDAR